MIESGYYPPGAEFDMNAPYNQAEIPEKEFDVTCVQTLSKQTTVLTSDYIPGASGCDYEPDGEGGCSSIGWQDPDDTSDTNWSKEYSENGHYTPIGLIGVLKERLIKELKELENSPVDSKFTYKKQQDIRKIKHLIEECDDWNEDETEIIND